jgi:hypothetical protein
MAWSCTLAKRYLQPTVLFGLKQLLGDNKKGSHRWLPWLLSLCRIYNCGGVPVEPPCGEVDSPLGVVAFGLVVGEFGIVLGVLGDVLGLGEVPGVAVGEFGVTVVAPG